MNLKLFSNFLKKLEDKKSVSKNTLILFSTSLIANLCTVLFYFYLAHKLTPSQYGIFGTIISIFSIFSVAAGTVCIVILKYISQFEAKCQVGKIHSLFSLFLRIFFFAGMAIFLVILFFSREISHILKMPTISPIILLGLFLFLYIIISLILNTLNGLQKFMTLGLNKIGLSALGLIFGILIVGSGFMVNGPIAALVLAALVMIPVGLLSLRPVFAARKVSIGKAGLNSYLGAALAASFCLGAILFMDVLFVKHFFDSSIAGYYAAAATLVSLLYFASASFSSVIFPKASELASEGRSTSHLLRYGLSYMGIICAIITALYFAFPDAIVGAIFGNAYKLSSFLFIYSISMSLLALINILVMYHLALRHLWIIAVLVPAVFVEIVLLLNFHSSIIQILAVMIFVFFALLAVIILFSRKELEEAFSKRTGYFQFSDFIEITRFSKKRL